MIRQLLATTFTALFLLAAGTANAASTTNAGSTPNGKPFQYIQTQMTSMQEEINTWIKTVLALQGTVAGLQGSITDLQGTVGTLQASVGTIQANITALQDRALLAANAIAFLQAQVVADQAQIASLSANVTANATQIASLQTAVDHINQISIPSLQNEINSINQDLQWKQNVLKGKCPDGQALSAINPNGSITCIMTTTVNNTYVTNNTTNVTSNYTQATVFAFQDMQANSNSGGQGGNATASATCPSGYSLTGGGFHVPSGVFVDSAGFDATHAQTWTVSANTTSKTPYSIFATAICVKPN